MATQGNGNGYVYAGVTRWGGGGSQSAKPGTLGGVFRMPVGGDEWTHMMTGFPEVIHVQCVTIHPRSRNVVFAGTHDGVYRSGDHGATWARMKLEPGGQQIWSITISPHDHRIMFAGASPIGIYKSEDGGESWQRVAGGSIADRLSMGNFKNRVMRIAVNPRDPRKLCAALEVNGAMASEDGGETWSDRNDALMRFVNEPRLRSQILTKSDAEGMLDAHALCMMPTDSETAFLANRMGIFRSRDNGRTWQDLEVGRQSEFTYGRDIRPSLCEPGVLYACLSVSSQGQTGSVVRSGDGGETWKRFDHDVTPHSTAMAVALHPDRPEFVYFAARKGEVFGTKDAGRSWQSYRLPAGCEGVYCVACG
jgi:photosystem II stability/assembly factor-like uncharacterized protein